MLSPLHVLILAACPQAGMLDEVRTEPSLHLNGDATQVISCPGDVNGDGSPDFISVSGTDFILVDGDSMQLLERHDIVTLWGQQGDLLELETGPDFSGDGTADFAARFSQGQVVLIASGGWTVWSTVSFQVVQSASSMCFVPDLDGDQVDDLVVGDESAQALEFLSTADGSALSSVSATESRFGKSIDRVGDLDGDSVDDLIVSYRTSPFSRYGRVRALSFPSMTTIWDDPFAAGSTRPRPYPSAVTTMEDLDGDGLREVITTSIGKRYSSPGEVICLSSQSGSILWRTYGKSHDGLGLSPHAVPDIDGDGIEDLVVGASGSHSNGGNVEFRSGVDGERLKRFHAGFNNDRNSGIGVRIRILGDVNEDGFPEVLAPFFRVASLQVPGVRVYSHFRGISPRELLVDLNSKDGDEIVARVPTRFAGQGYRVALAHSQHGHWHQGVYVPLEFDLMFLRSTGSSFGRFPGQVGVVPASGEWSVTIPAHASLSALVGQQVFVCLLVGDLASDSLSYASISVPLRVTSF